MKYKYYFRKPKTEIAKDVLICLALTGAVIVAMSSPSFVRSINRAIYKAIKSKIKGSKKYTPKQFSNVFGRLKREGCVIFEKRNNQIYISLTPKGKSKAGWLQIDALKISRPRQWDKKWRLVMFDISQSKKIYREALRGKLKQLGFKPFQKSIWIHPFGCKDELELLKDFFGLQDSELRLIVAENIGRDSDFRKAFNLK